MARMKLPTMRGNYQTGGRLYSVKNSESMTAEELMDSIRDKIQYILIEKAELAKKPDNPENGSNQGNNNQNYG